MARRMLRRGNGYALTAGLAVFLSLCASPRANAGRPADKPAYLWLWYADGSTQPSPDEACTSAKPSPFKCGYGAIEACQRQVLSILDTWYADFNLLFTLSRPSTGDYYTMIITSDGSWCPMTLTNPADELAVGFAFGNCNDNTGGTAYAFACGDNAQKCATIIAHEHAHKIGLEHTRSTTDVMNRYVLSTATGFDNQSSQLSIDDDLCRFGTQNSYEMMLAALGPWPGGAKPSPFAPAAPDAGAADAPITDASNEPHASGTVGPGPGPSEDGGVIVVLPGYDALVRPPLPTVEPPANNGASSHGGCSLTSRPIPPAALVVPLLCLLVAGLIRARGRRARLANEPLPCARPSRSTFPDPARGKE